MRLLYVACCDFAGDRLQGSYRKHCVDESPGSDEIARQQKRSAWIHEMARSYQALEADFLSNDADGNGRITLEELMDHSAQTNKGCKVDFAARIQLHMPQVDTDRSGDLDFWQFCFLAFLMSMDGSYSELVGNTRQSAIIKRSLISLQRLITHVNEEKNFRLTFTQISALIRSQFGTVPEQTQGLFDSLKYKSSAAKQDVVDVPRIIKLLYHLLLPTGRFSAEHYKPPAPVQLPEAATVLLPKTKTSVERRKRIHPVDPGKVKRLAKLGQGAQGVVYLAIYGGAGDKMAAKFLHNNATAQAFKEAEKEARVMGRMGQNRSVSVVVVVGLRGCCVVQIIQTATE